MYSVFESWMVTEYYAQRLDKSSMSLSAMFGIMTTLNSIVAILSGVLGESLVAATGTKVSPFMAAIVCLGLAFWLMTQYWVSLPVPFNLFSYILEYITNVQQTENYGDSANLQKLEIPEKSTLKIIFQGLCTLARCSLPFTQADYLPIFSRQAYLSFRLYILLLRRLYVHLCLLLVSSDEIRSCPLNEHCGQQRCV